MFNVRPNAISPWFHVEPPPVDEPPGFRAAPNGQSSASPFLSFGFNPGTGSAPSAGTDFEDAIRLASGLYGPADLATLRRNPIQEALDQITRIYAGVGPRLPSPLGRRRPSIGPVTPAGGLPRSPYTAEASLLKATVPSAPFSPMPGREFNVVISGRRPISTHGRYLPPPLH